MFANLSRKLQEILMNICHIREIQNEIYDLLNSKYKTVYSRGKTYNALIIVRDKDGGFTSNNFTFSKLSELNSFFKECSYADKDIEKIKIIEMENSIKKWFYKCNNWNY